MYTWGYLKENTLNKLNLSEEEANQQGFLSQFPYYANEAMTQICSSVKPHEKRFTIEITAENINTPVTMPGDFVSFNDAPVKFFEHNLITEDVGDDYIEYVGYNEIICKHKGVYSVPYNARWFFFTKETHNSFVIPAPADVCDAIPFYIVSQCLKIDDETKAAVYRNEYEMFLARIDDTSFKSQRTFHIGGGW